MNEEMYNYLCNILYSRTEDYNYSASARSAYKSCLWMLHYAHNDDLMALRNYDYHNVWEDGKEDEDC